jgi:uncharacterized protein
MTGGVQGTLAALRAAAALGVSVSEDFKSGLRVVLCSSKEEWELFDGLFDEYWNNVARQRVSPEHRAERRKLGASQSPDRSGSSLMSGGSGGDEVGAEGSQAVTGASEQERLRQADFSTLKQDDLAALEEISQRLVRRMSQRLSRRRRMAVTRGKIDLRRTIRASISRGGDPIDLRHVDRRPRPSRLMVLLDISGSMSPYSLFLLRFIFALEKHFKRVDVFLFSTELVEITAILRARRLSDALHALSHLATGWSGGTRIGASLKDFNRLYARKLYSGDTLFMILSDGWDTGEPEELSAELANIRRRVHKVIWLNPLLGSSDYQPLTQGMSAALPHVDVFAPAHNLASLLALERYI